MYSISLAIVGSWIHILIKHSVFPYYLFLSLSHTHTQSRMQQLWTREIEDHCLLYHLALGNAAGKARAAFFAPHFLLLVLQPLQEAEIKMENTPLWSEEVQTFFFLHARAGFISTWVLKWDIDIMRLYTYSSVSAFTWTPALVRTRLHLMLGEVLTFSYLTLALIILFFG